MTFGKAAAVLSIVIAAGLAVSGCTTPGPETTRSSSPSAPSTSSPTGTAVTEPPNAPTTAPPEEWTVGQLTTACIDFQGEWAEGEGLAADDFEWNTPASTQQDGDAWFVFLQGTITTPDGSSVPAEFTCTVTGPPSSPTVTEAPAAD